MAASASSSNPTAADKRWQVANLVFRIEGRTQFPPITMRHEVRMGFSKLIESGVMILSQAHLSASTQKTARLGADGELSHAVFSPLSVAIGFYRLMICSTCHPLPGLPRHISRAPNLRSTHSWDRGFVVLPNSQRQGSSSSP